MLLDCAQLKHWRLEEMIAQLDAGTLTYEELMYEMKTARQVMPVIEHEWNSLEQYIEGQTCLIHYTDMNRQPWLTLHNPNGQIWVDEMIRAVRRGFLTSRDVKREVLLCNVRPSLYFQLKFRRIQSLRQGKFLQIFDWGFIPPHVRLSKKMRGFKAFKSKLLQTVVLGIVRFV